MIDLSILTPAARSLIDDRVMPLGSGSPNAAVREQLNALTPESMFAAPLRNRAMAQCCLSALWLWHDFLDESHSLSQEIETPEGSWWHAIMHRREGDFGNSKYWFRRVGSHPAFAELGSPWDPFAFVDRCQRASGPEEAACREIQKREWYVLFDFCLKNAVTVPRNRGAS